MTFEIKQKTKVKVTIYGQVFELKKPTVAQVEELQGIADLEKKSAKEQFSIICDMLEVLGMPKDFTSDMEIDHLIDLIKYLSGELNLDKKKSEAGR